MIVFLTELLESFFGQPQPQRVVVRVEKQRPQPWAHCKERDQ